MDSNNFKNFSRFFSLVLCTRRGYICVFTCPNSRQLSKYFFYQVLDITYIHVSSFTTVYFETTFSFILKHIACAERTTSGNKFVEIDRGGQKLITNMNFPETDLSNKRQSLRITRNTFSPSINYHRYPHIRFDIHAHGSIIRYNCDRFGAVAAENFAKWGNGFDRCLVVVNHTDPVSSFLITLVPQSRPLIKRLARWRCCSVRRKMAVPRVSVFQNMN